MSTTVDRRELQMSFDSKQFEKNVERTCESLERLKEDMNFDKEAEGFERVEKASKNMDFSPVERSLERVSHKFDLFGSIAFSVVNRLTNTIINLGENIVKNLTINNVTDGWARYEQQLKSVQAVMAALKADVGSTREELELFDDVSKKMKTIAVYADETSHSMADMTNGISKVVAKTGDLDTAATAVMGIANWTSLAGGNAETASRMYVQLSQALSSYMKLQDWNSVKNAMMDITPVMQLFMEVASEGGEGWEPTLRKSADGLHYYMKALSSDIEAGANQWVKAGDLVKNAGEVTTKNFETTLTTGKWATKEVQLEVYRRLGEFAASFLEERNRLIENASDMDIDDSKFSIAKWKHSIRAIRDVEEEYKQANNIIGEFNEVQEAEFLEQSQEAIAKALAETTKGLDAETLALEGTMAALLEYSKDSLTLSREAFFKSYEATTLTESLESVKTTAKTQWAGIFEDIIGEYVDAKEIFTDLADDLINAFVGPVYDLRDAFDAWADMGKNLDFLEGIRNIAKAIESYKEPMNKAIQNVFGDGEGMLGVLINVTDWFKRFTEKIKLSGSAAKTFEKLWTVIFRLFSSLGNLIASTWPFVEKVFDLLLDVVDLGMDILDFLLSFNGDFSKTVEITDKAKGIFAKIAPILETIGSAVTTIAGIVGTAFKEVSKIIQTIADSGLFGVLSEGIKKIVESISNAFVELSPVATDFISNTLIPAITTAIKYVNKLFSSLFGGIEEGATTAIQSTGDVVKSTTNGLSLIAAHGYDDVPGGGENSSRYGGAKIAGKGEDGLLRIYGGTKEQQQALYEDYTAGLVDESGNLIKEEAKIAKNAGEKLKAIASETLVSVLTLVKSVVDGINNLISQIGTANLLNAIRYIGGVIAVVVLALTECILAVTDALTNSLSPALIVLGLVLAPLIVLVVEVIKNFITFGSTIRGLFKKLKTNDEFIVGNWSLLQTLGLIFGAIGIFAWSISKFMDTYDKIGAGKSWAALGALATILGIVGVMIYYISKISKATTTLTNELGGLGGGYTKGSGGSFSWGGLRNKTETDNAGGWFAAAPFIGVAAIILAVTGFVKAIGAIAVAEDIVGAESKLDKVMKALTTLTGFIATIAGIVAAMATVNRVFDYFSEKDAPVGADGKPKRADATNVFAGAFSFLLGVSAVITSLIPIALVAQTMDVNELNAFNNILVTIGHFIGGLVVALGVFALMTKKTEKFESTGSGWNTNYKETSSTMIGVATAMVMIMGAATALFGVFALMGSIKMSAGEVTAYLVMFGVILGLVAGSLILVSKFSTHESKRDEKSITEFSIERSDSLLRAGVAIALLINACTVFLHAVAETAKSISDKDMTDGLWDMTDVMLMCMALLLEITTLLGVMTLFTRSKSTSVSGTETKSAAQNILMTAIAITVVMNGLAILVGALGLISLSDKIIEGLGKMTEIVLVIATAVGIVGAAMSNGKISVGGLIAITTSLVSIILALALIAEKVVSNIQGGDFKTEPIVALIAWVSVIGVLISALAALVAKFMSSSSYGLAAWGIFEALIGTFIGIIAAFAYFIHVAAEFTTSLVELSKVKMTDILVSLADLLAATLTLNKIKINTSAADSMKKLTDFFKSLADYDDNKVKHVTSLAEALSNMATAVITIESTDLANDEIRGRFDAILDMYLDFFEKLRAVLENNPITDAEVTALSGNSGIMNGIALISQSVGTATVDIEQYVAAIGSLIGTLSTVSYIIPELANELKSGELTQSIKDLYTELQILDEKRQNGVNTMDWLLGMLSYLGEISTVMANATGGAGVFERFTSALERIAAALNSVDGSLVSKWQSFLYQYERLMGSGIAANDTALGSMQEEVHALFEKLMNGFGSGDMSALGVDTNAISANGGAAIGSITAANGLTTEGATSNTYYQTENNINVEVVNPDATADDIADKIVEAQDRANRTKGKTAEPVGVTGKYFVQ